MSLIVFNGRRLLLLLKYIIIIIMTCPEMSYLIRFKNERSFIRLSRIYLKFSH